MTQVMGLEVTMDVHACSLTTAFLPSLHTITWSQICWTLSCEPICFTLRSSYEAYALVGLHMLFFFSLKHLLSDYSFLPSNHHFLHSIPLGIIRLCYNYFLFTSVCSRNLNMYLIRVETTYYSCWYFWYRAWTQ